MTKETQRYSNKYHRMMPMKTSVNTFITTYVLYMLDKKGAMYGKAMIDEMTKRFKGSWAPSHGLVYPILNELEQSGVIEGRWITGSTRRHVKEYSLTERGQSVYKLEKEESEQAFIDSITMLELFMLDVYESEPLDFSDVEFNQERELSEVK